MKDAQTTLQTRRAQALVAGYLRELAAAGR
jgi:hypothetical protein